MRNACGSRSIALLLLLAGVAIAQAPREADPLEPILQPVLRSSVGSLVEHYRSERAYPPEVFPLGPANFEIFRQDVIGRLVRSLDLEAWVVREPPGKHSPIPHLFRDKMVKTIRHHGIDMEVHVIEILETGDRIPAVLCLPAGSGKRAAVATFSGHSKNGLRDLVVDLESYQRGVATRLAQAGLVSIAVEKLDTGYLSRTFPSGVDEKEIAAWRLGMSKVTRSVQLMASLAALEILAAHPRVDENRIGTTGVSLGGWLSVQAALLSDRVVAVADFGRKTVFLPEDTPPEQLTEIGDKCHILPGMFEVGDRNMLLLAYAPRPMLAGHGLQDRGSYEQSPRYYRDLFAAQYRALGKEDEFEYRVHEGGDTMPDEMVIEYFRRRFVLGRE